MLRLRTVSILANEGLMYQKEAKTSVDEDFLKAYVPCQYCQTAKYLVHATGYPPGVLGCAQCQLPVPQRTGTMQRHA